MDAQHDKLQAVLAQARAIRVQLKTQTAPAQTTPDPQRKPVKAGLMSQRQPSRPISKPSLSKRSTSMHDGTNSSATLARSTTSKGINKSKPGDLAPPTGKSSAAQQAQQRPLAEPAMAPDSSAGSTLVPHSGAQKKASSCPVPLQLPADFRKALNALRYHCRHKQTTV